MSFISYLINGISLGSVYAIIALGYTMVYGIAKMLNFAHGDVIMIGAYTILQLSAWQDYRRYLEFYFPLCSVRCLVLQLKRLLTVRYVRHPPRWLF